MEKTLKTYLEILYDGLVTANAIKKEVKERDPSAVEVNNKMAAFRFYDAECVTVDGKDYFGKKRIIPIGFILDKD